MFSAELLQRFRESTNGGFVLGSPKFEAADRRYAR
jgi:hypothetical protein